MDPPILSKAFWFTLAATFAVTPAYSQDLGASSVADDSVTEATPITTEEEFLAAGGRAIPAALATRRPTPTPPRVPHVPSTMEGPPFIPSLEHPEVGEIYRYVDDGWRFVGNGVLVENGHTIVTAAHVLRFHTGEIPTGRYRIEFTNVGLPHAAFDIVRAHSFTAASTEDPESPRRVMDDVAVAQIAFDVPPSIAMPSQIAAEAPSRGAPVSRVTHGPAAGFAGDGAHAPRHAFNETWRMGLSTLITLGDSGGGLFLGNAQAHGALFALSTALLRETRQNIFIPLGPFLARFASVTTVWQPPLTSLTEFDANLVIDATPRRDLP